MKHDVTLNSEKKPAGRTKVSGNSLTNRSRITNGSALAFDLDGRSSWARRFRDLIHEYEFDLGGREVLSGGQRSLARRAALLQVELEFLEAKLASLHECGKEPAPYRLELYQRLSNTLRRLVESLGLNSGRIGRTINGDVTGNFLDRVGGGP